MTVKLGDTVERIPVTIAVREEELLSPIPKKKRAKAPAPPPVKRTMKGTVVYIHPKGRYHTVAFRTPGGVIRESFLGVER